MERETRLTIPYIKIRAHVSFREGFIARHTGNYADRYEEGYNKSRSVESIYVPHEKMHNEPWASITVGLTQVFCVHKMRAEGVAQLKFVVREGVPRWQRCGRVGPPCTQSPTLAMRAGDRILGYCELSWACTTPGRTHYHKSYQCSPLRSLH